MFLWGFRVRSLMPLLPEGSSCYIPWLGRWCLSSMLHPVSLVRLLFFGGFSSFFSRASSASRHYYSLHCLSFVFHYRYRDLLRSFFMLSLSPLGISLALLTLPLALSLPLACPVLLAFAFSLTGCFVSLALLSGSPRSWAFLRVFLGHYWLSSASSMAVHFYHLRCSPLGSFPHLWSSSTSFRVFFCLPQLQVSVHWLFFLFISSFEFLRFRCPFS